MNKAEFMEQLDGLDDYDVHTVYWETYVGIQDQLIELKKAVYSTGDIVEMECAIDELFYLLDIEPTIGELKVKHESRDH